MRRWIAFILLVSAALVAGCGVTTEDEPEQLTVSPPAPATTPTIAQQPDTSTTPVNPVTPTTMEPPVPTGR
ncbi:hypothetical protein [Amycolatopsis sp.]|uniref:hypothetical protein n=1 Tax=Amycolatopsis sp. TaxID=37632 RepID=UPI002C0B2ECD|nr:hypothetical protein [Amycolatopsis sp.]HVV12040.1 hypothetical protein [Amycolatopsis sp.]